MLDLQWRQMARDEWEALFDKAPRSNLLQSWAYGEAKAEIEGVTVRRAVIDQAGRPAALVQALERRIAGLRVVRINRGPLWIMPPAPDELTQAYRLLREANRWFRGRLLAIAPEFAEKPATLAGFGCFRRAAPRWRSAWIDLTLSPAQQRERFERRWRNKLTSAERAGVQMITDPGDGAYSWLMERYRAHMREHGYQGIPSALLDAMRARRRKPDDILVCRARLGDDWLAGILLARHGSSATYLIGWSGEAGRRTHAINVLLFNVLGLLASRGCRWLDLGGIDDTQTPGVATFKRGMRGDEYALAGEYICL